MTILQILQSIKLTFNMGRSVLVYYVHHNIIKYLRNYYLKKNTSITAKRPHKYLANITEISKQFQQTQTLI